VDAFAGIEKAAKKMLLYTTQVSVMEKAGYFHQWQRMDESDRSNILPAPARTHCKSSAMRECWLSHPVLNSRYSVDRTEIHVLSARPKSAVASLRKMLVLKSLSR
jgi:hypothetical protein